MTTVSVSSSINPGDPIVVSIDWTPIGEYFNIYVETLLGEELAATWNINPFPNAPATFSEGFGGTNPMYADPSVVSIYRYAGWDNQSGTISVRVVHKYSAGSEEEDTFTVTLDSTLPVVRDDTHTATGLDRMLDQFDGSVNLRHLASSYLDQAQSLEDVAYQLINARSLAIVSGDRLDGLGQIVNVPRSGRTDVDYRLRIRAELAVLLSQGSLEDLIAVLQLLIGMPSPPSIQIDEYYPKAIYMRARNFVVDEDPVMIANLLRRAVSAATYLQFIYTTVEADDDDLFRFSDTNGTSETSSSHGYSNGMFTGAK
jgi:hypothetical protein